MGSSLASKPLTFCLGACCPVVWDAVIFPSRDVTSFPREVPGKGSLTTLRVRSLLLTGSGGENAGGIQPVPVEGEPLQIRRSLMKGRHPETSALFLSPLMPPDQLSIPAVFLILFHIFFHSWKDLHTALRNFAFS